MLKDKNLTLRTRHIHCFYCIALLFFVLAIVLFALSSEQSKVLGNQQSRVPTVVAASIILVLSVITFIWVTYYAVRYFRSKKQEKLHRAKQHELANTARKTSVVIFDNAAFASDGLPVMNSRTDIQAFT